MGVQRCSGRCGQEVLPRAWILGECALDSKQPPSAGGSQLQPREAPSRGGRATEEQQRVWLLPERDSLPGEPMGKKLHGKEPVGMSQTPPGKSQGQAPGPRLFHKSNPEGFTSSTPLLLHRTMRHTVLIGKVVHPQLPPQGWTPPEGSTKTSDKCESLTVCEAPSYVLCTKELIWSPHLSV